MTFKPESPVFFDPSEFAGNDTVFSMSVYKPEFIFSKINEVAVNGSGFQSFEIQEDMFVHHPLIENMRTLIYTYGTTFSIDTYLSFPHTFNENPNLSYYSQSRADVVKSILESEGYTLKQADKYEYGEKKQCFLISPHSQSVIFRRSDNNYKWPVWELDLGYSSRYANEMAIMKNVKEEELHPDRSQYAKEYLLPLVKNGKAIPIDINLSTASYIEKLSDELQFTLYCNGYARGVMSIVNALLTEANIKVPLTRVSLSYPPQRAFLGHELNEHNEALDRVEDKKYQDIFPIKKVLATSTLAEMEKIPTWHDSEITIMEEENKNLLNFIQRNLYSLNINPTTLDASYGALLTYRIIRKQADYLGIKLPVISKEMIDSFLPEMRSLINQGEFNNNLRFTNLFKETGIEWVNEYMKEARILTDGYYFGVFEVLSLFKKAITNQKLQEIYISPSETTRD